VLPGIAAVDAEIRGRLFGRRVGVNGRTVVVLRMVVVPVGVDVQQAGVRRRRQQAEGDQERRQTSHGPSVSEVRPPSALPFC